MKIWYEVWDNGKLSCMILPLNGKNAIIDTNDKNSRKGLKKSGTPFSAG